jgi:hypothetical protein
MAPQDELDASSGPAAGLGDVAVNGGDETNEPRRAVPGRNGISPEYQRLLGHLGVNPVDWECC